MTIRILMVDDYKDWRCKVRVLLQTRPEWQVICEVSDGPEAVQKAEELKPDLILLDIGLPTLNGIEVARRIRRLSFNPRIIFLSADNSLDTVHVAMDTGAQGYVYKPHAQNDLLAAIDAVLRGGKFVSSILEGHKSDARESKSPHRHEVLFYADEALLLDRFANFIAAALAAGDVAVAVANEPHRESLGRRLKAQGVDVEAALRDGTYISLDVAKTLSTFIVNDMPDANLFLEVMGGFIRSAAKAGKGTHPRVAACGECAPLLRARGKEEAAIRLEQLWDQLVTTYQVDILCGYASSSFRGEEGEDVYERICAAHSAIFHT